MTRALIGTAMVLMCTATAAVQPSPPFPSPGEFAGRLRQAVRLDYQLQQDFTYVEHRRDVKISKLGKVTIGPLRTFQVIPSPVSGQTYKRLIAIEGTPLAADELARRDAEHEREARAALAREQRESPAQRAERVRDDTEAQRQREAILDDAFRVYEATIVRRDRVDGLPVLVARMRPRPGAEPLTREGRWMTHFEGELWAAESDAQIVRIDMRATSDVTIGWGVVGRIHKGSRVLYARRRFENAWLPAETTYEASGRTMIFRPFRFNVTTTYSDYKRRDKTVNH
jgi:hypothetical protein